MFVWDKRHNYLYPLFTWLDLFLNLMAYNLYVFAVTYLITINKGESLKIPKSCTLEIQILKFAVYPQNMNDLRLNG